MKRRVLIFNPYGGSMPHHETALEMGLELQSQGFEPHFMVCRSELKTCDLNPHHRYMDCLRCRSFSKSSLDLIGIPREQIHRMDIQAKIDVRTIPRFQHVNDLKTYKVDGIPVGEAVAFSIIIALTRDSEPDMEKFRYFYLRAIPSYLSIYYSVVKCIRTLKPEILYVFHGHSLVYAAAIEAAKKCGVEFYVGERDHVREYILMKNHGGLDVDHVAREVVEAKEAMLHDPNGVAIGTSWFEGNRKGNLQQVFNFLRDQEAGELPTNFDPSKRNIAIFGSSEDELQACVRFMNPWFANQSEGIRYLLDKIKDQNFHFYLRVHPNLTNPKCAQRRQLNALRADNLTILDANSSVDTYALLAHCEKSLTFGSTMGVEATFWGMPSILAGRAFYERLDASYVAKSPENLVELVRTRLSPKPKLNATGYGYWWKTRGTAFRFLNPTNRYTGEGPNYKGKPIRVSRPVSAIFRIRHYWNLTKLRANKFLCSIGSVKVNETSKQS